MVITDHLIVQGLLTLVIAERLAELFISERNRKALLARGAYEAGAGHYPFMIAIHVCWLVAIVTWAVHGDVRVSLPLVAVYALVQVFRVWVMASLGPYWTTRIITVPDAPLVAKGPYRFLRHPNYVVVVIEIALLPLALGAWHIALVFSVLNAAILWVRITAENAALAPRARPR